jgi:hypothetical protein
MPPQNLVDRTIVDGPALGVKLASPDASRALRLRKKIEDLTEVEQKVGLSRNLSTSVADKRGT